MPENMKLAAKELSGFGLAKSDITTCEKLQYLAFAFPNSPCPAVVSFCFYPGKAHFLLPVLWIGLMDISLSLKSDASFSSITQHRGLPIFFISPLIKAQQPLWKATVTVLQVTRYLRITKIKANIAYSNEKQKSFQKGNWRKQLGLILLWAPFATRRNFNCNVPNIPRVWFSFFFPWKYADMPT